MKPVKVGLLFSSTGPTAYVERTQLNAALLAIDEVNAAGGVGGSPVVPVVRDARSSPEACSALAEQMLGEEGVPLIIGCYMSNARQAVMPAVERRNAVLVYPSPYEGFEYSRNVFYGGAVPNQHIMLLARHLLRQGARRFYLVGTRYMFPVESNRVMMTLVAERKGEVLAERYVELDARSRDLRSIAENIRAKQPDVVFCTIVGEAAKRFFEACHEAGVDRSTTRYASLTITEAEVDHIGAHLLEGQLTAATYFESLPSEANRRFVGAYRGMFGAQARVNAMAESAYSLGRMVLEAAGRCGSLDPDALRAELAQAAFDAPQGRIRMDPDNNHFFLWPRLGRVGADGAFEIVESVRDPVKPDPYMIEHELDDMAEGAGVGEAGP